MKRFIAIFIAAFAAALTISAHEANMPDPAQSVTKEYNLSGFNELAISHTYHVDLTRSDRYSVTLDVPDFLVPYLIVEVRGNCLVLGLNELPRDIRHRLDSGRFRLNASVSMPDLTGLRMSGASNLRTESEFAPRRSFSATLSGACSVEGLTIRTQSASVGCSGACSFRISGSFDRLDVKASGSSKIRLATNAKDAEVMLSGASNVNLDGRIDKLEVQASGASHYSQKGQIGNLVGRASGSSQIYTDEAPTTTASVSLSGASRARVDVSDTLGVTLSGASRLEYRANDRLRFQHKEVSRASSVSSFR